MTDVKMDLVVLYCSDLAACHSFYQALGLDFTRERHSAGPEHYSTTFTDGTVLELYPSGTKGPTGRVRLGITMRQQDVRRTRLAPGHHILHDPEGHTIDVHITD